jgi:hypothetical protein
MDAKHRSVQILGILTVSGGSIYGLFAVGAFFSSFLLSDIWLLLTRVLNLAVGVYLIWAGIRMFRWAKGLPSLQTGRVKCGRVLLGSLFMFNAIKTHLHPPPSADVLQPANQVQAEAMVAIYIAVAILGACLFISGVVAGFRAPVDSEVGVGKPRVL